MSIDFLYLSHKRPIHSGNLRTDNNVRMSAHRTDEDSPFEVTVRFTPKDDINCKYLMDKQDPLEVASFFKSLAEGY